MISVYGSSDDRIEIEGDLSEEFPLPRDDFAYVGFSNGVLLKVSYEGDWFIRIVHDPEHICIHLPAGSEEATSFTGREYSDVVHMTGTDVDWAVSGDSVARA